MAVQNRMLTKAIEDPWMQIAALSAGPDRASQLFKAARAFANRESEAHGTFFRQTAAVIAARRKPEEIRQVLETVLRTSDASTPRTGIPAQETRGC